MQTRKTDLFVAVDTGRGRRAHLEEGLRTRTSCQVTLKVLKADPRRVDAPVLYTILMDCRCDTGNDHGPRRLFRCSSGLMARSMRD